ncbi:hypothetical protein AcV5_001482 [Taiwanofungus camphoratus]|nr:hypothetical protein AcV5_001482 [Antrodia cinnamomea]
MNTDITLLDLAMHLLPGTSLMSTVPAFLLVALFVLLHFLVSVTYHAFFSPLAALPGPWYAAISDFWLTTHILRLQQCMTVQALFERYGPVVRAGPKKVVFCDLKTVSSVYRVHKFDKSPYYKNFQINGNDQTMTVLPNAQHTLRRKAYAPHYNPSNLGPYQLELHIFALKVVDIFNRVAGKASVECLDFFCHLMVDIITVAVLGFYPESLSNWTSNVQNPLTIAVHDFPKKGTLHDLFPMWAWKLVSRFPNDRWRQICNCDKIVAQYVGGQLHKLRFKALTGQTAGQVDIEKISLLHRLLQSGMPDEDIISESVGHLIAGVDTSSITLSYLFWELSRRPDVAMRLRAEINEAMPDPRDIPDISTLYKLPYLDAFIKEGQRLYSAAPSLLERVVPGKAGDECFQIMGHTLPPGTVVATQAWSMHRDADIFPCPDTFSPERWLVAEGAKGENDRLVRMTQHMMPFGLGTRVCAGRNLAQMGLRIVVAALVRNFDVAADVKETNEESMRMREAFNMFPASKECRLIFNPRGY